MIAFEDWFHAPTDWRPFSPDLEFYKIPLLFRRFLTTSQNYYLSVCASPQEPDGEQQNLEEPLNPQPVTSYTPIVYLDYTRPGADLELAWEVPTSYTRMIDFLDVIRTIEYGFTARYEQEQATYRIQKVDFPHAFLSKYMTPAEKFQFPAISAKLINDMAHNIENFMPLRSGMLTFAVDNLQIDPEMASMYFYTRMVTRLYHLIHSRNSTLWHNNRVAHRVLERIGYSHELCRDDYVDGMIAELGGKDELIQWIIRHEQKRPLQPDQDGMLGFLDAANGWITN